MANMVSDAELAALMAPFPTCTLGWFCLGFHTNAAPGRAPAIARLLDAAHLLPPNTSATTVSHVLARLLSAVPHLLTLKMPRSIATYTPVLAAQQPEMLMNVLEFVPCSGPSTCACGRPLVLWRQVQAHCFTFARGLVAAQVLFLRCFPCSAVYGPSPRSAAFSHVSHVSYCHVTRLNYNYRVPTTHRGTLTTVALLSSL